jgi:small-conductance mechanosensitive channel
MRNLVFRIGLVLALLAPAAAYAQHAAVTAPAASAAPAPTPALTPAQMQAVLDVLNDPQKRAAFTATLQNMSRAVAAVKPAPPPAAVPLAPNSVGAQVLAQGTAALANLTVEASAFGHVLGNLPAVWNFTERSVRDPADRARLIDAGWHVMVILAAAIGIELVLALALRRPVAAIAASAPGGPIAPPAPGGPISPAAPDAEPGDEDFPDAAASPLAGETEAERVEEEQRHHRFSRALRVLKRLPFIMLRLVLNLIPLAACTAVFYGGSILTEPPTRDMLRLAVIAYLACRLATIATRAIVSPEHPALRMVHLSDQGAAYALIWVRRLAVVAATGFALSGIGLLFGLPQPAADAFIKTTMLLDHAFLVVIVLQCRASVAAHIRAPAGKTGAAAMFRNRLASIWHLIAIFFIVGLWLVWAAEVRHGYAKIWRIFLVTLAVTGIARMAGIVILGLVDRAFRISPAMAARYPGLEARANRYYPMLRGTVSAVLVLATFVALLQAWGINTVAWFHPGALGDRLISSALTIGAAGLVALAVWELLNASLERQLARMTREAQIVKSARLRTLMPILRTVLMIALVAIFGLTTLSEIGVNIAPLLAGAGILGVAIGFGSQKLVQDFITGIFLLLENAMQVGDAVTVAGLSGSVENLSIRTMRLRAGDGSVHIIPFSSVSTVTNSNRGIGNAAVTVTVPVSEDTDHVSDVLSEIAADMRAEQRFTDLMRSDLQLWGVDKVDGGNVSIVGQIVCTDGGRWGVQREFNRRMNMRFKELGIAIATPTQTVIHRSPEAPHKPASGDEAAPPAATLPESPPPTALGNTS